MDSPLAPVLANIFIGFHKSKWLNEYNFNKPNIYLRHVDGILAAVDNEQDSLNFLNFLKFLNNRLPNIKSTIKNKLTIPSLFLMYSFQVSIIKISHFKHITNRPIQEFS